MSYTINAQNALYLRYKKIAKKQQINVNDFFLILQFLLNRKYSQIKQDFIKGSVPLNFKQKSKLKKIIKKMEKNNYYWEYEMRRMFFYDRAMYIEEPVFLPRQNQEHLLEFVQEHTNKENLNIIEFGVGSAAVLSILADKNPKNAYYGIDICRSALKVARINTKKLDNVFIIRNDWTKKLNLDIEIDCIYSNPPYVFFHDKKLHDSEVSLYGNKWNILDYYYDLITYSFYHLKQNGILIFELSTAIYKNFLIDINPLIKFEVIKDEHGVVTFLILKMTENKEIWKKRQAERKKNSENNSK